MATKQPRKLEDFGKLTQAEQQVLDELDTGEVIRLGDGKVPPEDAGPSHRCVAARRPPLPSSPTRGEEAHRATVAARRRRALRHHQERLSE